MAEKQPEISANPKTATIGLFLNQIPSQIPKGGMSWAINAVNEGFDGNQITYSNEPANKPCKEFPAGYRSIGSRNITEENYILFWLVNPLTDDSEIGIVQDCVYTTKINAKCLNLSIDNPILKHAHRKNNCGVEIYWVDSKNRTRFIDLSNLPYKEIDDRESCDPVLTTEIDCNKLNLQPDFLIPQISITTVEGDGELTAGSYQFAVQYANGLLEPYTSYYSITNPLPIFDPFKITQDFNYIVGKSINIKISNIDTTGIYDYINLAVIKTINNITSVELVGNFNITGDTLTISYTGQGKTDIKLDINEVFQKYPVYTSANDLTVAQDVLILSDLTVQERISYQSIASKIKLQWQTWRLKGTPFYKELESVYNRGYMGDEVYPFEVVFLLTSGYQTDGFTIPARVSNPYDLEMISNKDVISQDSTECNSPAESMPRWKVYNTATVTGYEQQYTDNKNDPCYEGPYQYGEFAYWESTDVYPCNEIYGELKGKPIRYPKFPDSKIVHIHDSLGYIYAKGIKIDLQEITDLIKESALTEEQKKNIQGIKIVRGNRANSKSIIAKGLIHNVGKYDRDNQVYYFPNYPYNDLREDPFLAIRRTNDDSGKNEDIRLDAYTTDESKQRFVFHSPDTHFYQPTLGNMLKLETAEFGKAKGHFVQVRKHARYKFLTTGSYTFSLIIAIAIGVASSSAVVGNIFNGQAAFTAYSVLLDIIDKLTPRRNFAYQFNSIGNYTDFKTIDNAGNKQRSIDIAYYLIPGMQSVGDLHSINNYQRESSVYVRTGGLLPFPDTVAGVPIDQSRWLPSDSNETIVTQDVENSDDFPPPDPLLPPNPNNPPVPRDTIQISRSNCSKPDSIESRDISSYYASIKRDIENQYGQLYSYETVDTGSQFLIDLSKTVPDRYKSVFGGDTFINKFGYKSKLPYFIDNRIEFPDDADVEYDEIPNVSNPIFWFSTSPVPSSPEEGKIKLLSSIKKAIKRLFGVKRNNFDCIDDKFFYQNGKIYLFNYGIPYFFVESEVNVDLRQAYNGKEGDFFPRVSSDIPDDWLQEINSTIQQDNTYWYNKSYSKQNKENSFSHLPLDFTQDKCREIFPFRAVFSEPKTDSPNPSLRNNWRIFKPSSIYNFPQSYGKLTSLDGIENKQVLARFENKTQLYNALLTMPTSIAQAYLGQSLFSQQVPPIDYADTDNGYIGSQHKFLSKTEYGHITIDAKRGDIFLLQGQQGKSITGENVSSFFHEFLSFKILEQFPDYNIDNHYKGIGLHGVYDSRYKRFILTKLDYKANFTDITLKNGSFYRNNTKIELTDTKYFCNQSFTVSYDFKTQAWLSFHTYLPNYYVGLGNKFLSGIGDNNSSIWEHNTVFTKFNNFYGKIHPYVIEYPYSYTFNDEILQNIKDYSKVLKYNDFREFIDTEDFYFNKLTVYNSQQSTGIIELVKKPSNNLKARSQYPVYNTDSKVVTFTKSGGFYQVNTFWDMVKDTTKPIWKKSCENLSIYKELNQDNHDYSKRSFRKSPIRGKELKIRLILDNDDSIKIISVFTVSPTQISHK